MTEFNEALAAMLPQRKAYQLPSVQTEHQLEVALEADDIESVKSQLVHVWGHYQALEILLHAADNNNDSMLGAVHTFCDDQGLDFDSLTATQALTLAQRITATEFVDFAYDITHQTTLAIVLGGLTMPEAVKSGFSQLDFTDPDKPETDDDVLAKLDFEPDTEN